MRYGGEQVVTGETQEAVETKWEKEETSEMMSTTDLTDDCFEYFFVPDMNHGEIVRVLLLLFSCLLLG